MATSENSYTGFEIAVIGLAGRFPGAKNVEAFWQNLCQGVESISFFSDAELEAAGVEQASYRNPAYVKAGAILDEVEMFDADFFGFNPREAELMDPQHRIFLECVWEALENAGYDPETYPRAIGLFGGTQRSTYLSANLQTTADLGFVNEFQVFLSNAPDFLTTRVSYKLNLKGPSINISTACSTSLVAVHVACQNLLSGACNLALAGGVAISLPQTNGYLYQEGGIGSPDGHCRTFDERAQGTVGGNGVGVVVLKRLEEALADNDYIYAVIKGSAVNNDGALKVGFTAPSVEGQAKVIRAAQVMAEVSPETITYIEAHGTATPLGDPIEMKALTEVFRAKTAQKTFCAIGSVKTNFGHLDSAAGVAGLIKTILALKHKQLPPSLHFERPNPAIDFANSPFYVNTQLADWPQGETPRRAGVSSFGIGGTNAHVILEEAPAVKVETSAKPGQVLVLSAQSETALATMTSNLAAYLRQQPEPTLADVARTLQVGRRAFNYRRAVVCNDVVEAVQALESLDPKRVFTGSGQVDKRPVVFMFSGQGAQYVNMGRELYEVEPVFRRQIDQCAEVLRPQLGLDLRTVLYPNSAGALDGGGQQLQQTALTQPALFVLEYALAKLWQAWGVRPRAMIGHSIGEYVAACLAGVFSLEEALELVAIRGQLMQQLPGGAMLAVSLTEEEARPLLGQTLALAAVNAPARCVIAGPVEAVEALEKQLTDQGVVNRRLRTSHAFHSAMMEPMLALFAARVRRVTLKPPQLPFVSNVTGDWITASEATDPDYWVKHLRQTVRFADGLQTLAQEPHRILLEVGPGGSLSAMARQQPGWSSQAMSLATLRATNDEQPDRAFLLKTLSQLWLAGVAITWSAFGADEKRHRVILPTYPFERKRYWIEPGKPQGGQSNGDQPAENANQPTPQEIIKPVLAAPTILSAESEAFDDELSTDIERVIEQQLQFLNAQLDIIAAEAE